MLKINSQSLNNSEISNYLIKFEMQTVNKNFTKKIHSYSLFCIKTTKWIYLKKMK